MFYELISGNLTIDTKHLAADLLKDSSDFRFYITKNSSYYRPPEITRENGKVTINFYNGTDIELDKNYISKFKDLKLKYGDKLGGRVDIRITSNCIHTSHIDLNGSSIKVY